MKNKSNYASVVLRVVVGIGFVVHGYAKLARGVSGFEKLLDHLQIPFPHLFAWVATLTEFAGGILLIAGFLVVYVSIPLIVTMLTALFSVHIRYSFSSINTVGLTSDGPQFGPPGYEINLLYIAALVALILMGSGKFSLDSMLKKSSDKGL
jgi:putative oxidoreductase